MRVISEPTQWAGELPAVLVARAQDRAARRGLLRVLVARVLGCGLDEVEIIHREGRAPALLRPTGTGLHLSSASRGDLAALAVGRKPLGVDLERVEPGAEPPWNVLHLDERARLAALEPGARGRAFAGLWAAKEAYLKMLGLGLSREPSGFAVRPSGEDGLLSVDDPEAGGPATVSVTWLTECGSQFAVALASR